MGNIKILLLFITLIFSPYMYSQFSINKIDEFTGDRIIATKGVVLQRSMMQSFVLNLKYQNSNSYIGCTLTTDKCYNIYKEESCIYIKFTDNSVRKAICYDNATADYTIIYGATLWKTSMIYIPEPGLIEDLSNKLISKYRYETSNFFYEHEVKSKKAIEFREQARAFSAMIPKL